MTPMIMPAIAPVLSDDEGDVFALGMSLEQVMVTARVRPWLQKGCGHVDRKGAVMVTERVRSR